MEFYKRLTVLLKSARELKALDKLKASEQDKEVKKKKSKEFKDKLIPFLEFQTFSKESQNFRKYWIQYLDKLIDSSLLYCTKSEIETIMKLINGTNEGKDNHTNNENKNKINIMNKNNEKNLLENYHNEGIALNLNNKNQLELLRLNLEKIESYKPSKYKKEGNKDIEKKKN